MATADASGEPVPVVSLRAAATIAHSLLATRNSVGLLVLGEGLSSASCGSGRKQLELILNVLSHSKVGRSWELMRVPDLLGLRFPGLRQVMVITPMVDDGSLDAIARISGTGHVVTIVSPSPYHPKESLMSTKPEVLAEKLLILDRASRLATARGFALVVDWQSGEPLLPRLRQAHMIDRRR
jgi:uncharacterized protein (DUF58 family)